MFAEVLAGNFTHAMVPYGSLPQPMAKVDTRAEAKNYAVDGFHVSVIRGEAGGCKDSASGFAKAGTDPNGACKLPLGRDDLSIAWDAAAGAYKAAYDAWVAGKTWREIKALLEPANLLADKAYGLEGVEPPRYIEPTPQPDGTVAPVSRADPMGGGQARRKKIIAASVGVAGLIGFLGLMGLAGAKGAKGGKGSKRSTAKGSGSKGRKGSKSAARYM